MDIVDGDLTASILSGGLPIDTLVLGPHHVTYNVSDLAGNPAMEVTRTVKVVDTTAPVFLNVPNPIKVEGETLSGAHTTKDIIKFLEGAIAIDGGAAYRLRTMPPSSSRLILLLK